MYEVFSLRECDLLYGCHLRTVVKLLDRSCSVTEVQEDTVIFSSECPVLIDVSSLFEASRSNPFLHHLSA